MAPLERPPNLHRLVVEQLRRFIVAHCEAGQALPPVRRLMVELGVSHSTLRAAQALLAQEGYLDIRHGSGVYVCERAVTRRVGIYSELDLLQPRISRYHGELVRGLRTYFRSRGVQAEVYLGETESGREEPDQPTCARFLEDIAARRVDGVAFVDPATTCGWGDWVAKFPLPAAGLWCRHDVEIDLVAMLRAGVEHLIQQGCAHLALLAWGHGADTFGDCLAARGLVYRPGWNRHDLPPDSGGAG